MDGLKHRLDDSVRRSRHDRHGDTGLTDLCQQVQHTRTPRHLSFPVEGRDHRDELVPHILGGCRFPNLSGHRLADIGHRSTSEATGLFGLPHDSVGGQNRQFCLDPARFCIDEGPVKVPQHRRKTVGSRGVQGRLTWR